MLQLMFIILNLFIKKKHYKQQQMHKKQKIFAVTGCEIQPSIMQLQIYDKWKTLSVKIGQFDPDTTQKLMEIILDCRISCTCLCLRKSRAIWTFCSLWKRMRPFSLGCWTQNISVRRSGNHRLITVRDKYYEWVQFTQTKSGHFCILKNIHCLSKVSQLLPGHLRWIRSGDWTSHFVPQNT